MSAKYKVGDLVHVFTSKSKFHEAKDWGLCKVIMLHSHQDTGEFDGYLCEDSVGDKVSIDEDSILSLKEDN